MRKLLSTPLAALLALLLGGCTPALEETPPGSALDVRAGETFTLVLDSNPTTGYHWELLEEPDGRVVRLVEREYRADQPVAIGSGGMDVWSFEAVAPGTDTLSLGYFPPDETGDPAEVREHVVRVR